MSDQKLLTDFTDILTQCIDNVRGAHCVFLSTLDGHPLLKVESVDFPIDFLSPLGGSLLSVSETVAAQFNAESLDHTIVFMDELLFALLKVHDADDSLFLGVIASNKVSVGMMLSFGKAAIRSIQSKL